MRTNLSAPVRLRIAGQEEWAEGVTCNISRSGVLIETYAKVPSEAPIEITFMLRRKGDKPLQVTAQVVRVEEVVGGMPRTAARFDAQMRLEISEEPSRT